jgi:hypothetical protein
MHPMHTSCRCSFLFTRSMPPSATPEAFTNFNLQHTPPVFLCIFARCSKKYSQGEAGGESALCDSVTLLSDLRMNSAASGNHHWHDRHLLALLRKSSLVSYTREVLFSDTFLWPASAPLMFPRNTSSWALYLILKGPSQLGDQLPNLLSCIPNGKIVFHTNSWT